MKNFLYYLAAVTLLVTMSFPVKAGYLDLTGADVIGEAQVCVFKGKIRACVLLEKGGKRYQVVADQKGELYIYLVETKEENGVTVVKRATLIWSRDSV